MKTLLTLAIATLCCALLGCGGAQTKASTEPAATPAAAAAPATSPAPAAAASVPAGEVKCPVSGEGFTPSAASPSSEYNGKTYYFCCPGCKKKFDADPAKFAAKPAPAKAADVKPCGGDCATGKPCADCADKEGAKKEPGK